MRTESQRKRLYIKARGAIFIVLLGCNLGYALDKVEAGVVTTIVLTNGDRITGTILTVDKDAISISTKYAGTVLISRDAIQTLPSVDTETSQVTTQSVVAPLSAPTSAVAARPSIGLLSTKVSLGFTGSAQRDQSYSTALSFFANEGHNADGSYRARTLLLLAPSYDEKWKATAHSANVTQVYVGTLQQLFRANSPRISPFLIGSAYHNNGQGVRVDQAYGLGILERVHLARHNSLEFDEDVRAIGDNLYKPGKDAWLVGSALSVAYTKLWLPSDNALTVKVGSVPVFNQGDAWRASGSVDYALKLSKSLSIVFETADNYFQIAPKTFNKNYIKTGLTLQYKPPWAAAGATAH